MTEEQTTEVVTRNPDGTFPKGVSGNPAGRALGTKTHLVQVKQQLEAAVRANITPAKISKIVDKMIDMALEGNVKAAKLILDKTISPAAVTEDEEGGDTKYVFVIKNATFKKGAQDGPGPATVDAEFTEVSGS